MEPNPDRNMIWAINNKTVCEGPGANQLTYTFPEPGTYVLTYVERKGEGIVASASASTVVHALPPVIVETKVNASTTLAAPAGFGKYQWTLNGQELGTQAKQQHVFTAPGLYTMEVRASEPAGGELGEFLRYTFEVTVR